MAGHSFDCHWKLMTTATSRVPTPLLRIAAFLGSSRAKTKLELPTVKIRSFTHLSNRPKVSDPPVRPFEFRKADKLSLQDVRKLMAPAQLHVPPVPRETERGPRAAPLLIHGAAGTSEARNAGNLQGGWLHNHWADRPAGVATRSNHVDTTDWKTQAAAFPSVFRIPRPALLEVKCASEPTLPSTAPAPPPPPAPPAFPAAQVHATSGGLLKELQRNPLIKSRSLDEQATVSFGTRKEKTHEAPDSSARDAARGRLSHSDLFGGTLPAELLRKIAERRAVLDLESEQRAVDDETAAPKVVHVHYKGEEKGATGVNNAFAGPPGRQKDSAVKNDMMTELRQKLATRANNPSG